MIKNLIYYVCPFAQADCRVEWENNIAVLRQYIHKFDGRKIVTIATGPKMVDPKEVARYFDGTGCEIEEIPNRRKAGENIPFANALLKLEGDDRNAMTFYAHAKGVSPKHHKMPHHDLRSMRTWRNLMYHCNLSDVEYVESVLQKQKSFGILKRSDDELPTPWYYPGTFFWFRHDAVFGHGDWNHVEDHYCGVEMYLGRLLDNEDAHSDLNGASPIATRDLYSTEREGWTAAIAGHEVTIEEIENMNNLCIENSGYTYYDPEPRTFRSQTTDAQAGVSTGYTCFSVVLAQPALQNFPHAVAGQLRANMNQFRQFEGRQTRPQQLD